MDVLAKKIEGNLEIICVLMLTKQICTCVTCCCCVPGLTQKITDILTHKYVDPASFDPDNREQVKAEWERDFLELKTKQY